MGRAWTFRRVVGGFAAILLATVAMAQARLPTDAVVRSEMEAIRAAIIEHHTLITHRRLPIAMARLFKDRVGHSLEAIRAATRVAEEARAALDPLLAKIDAGAQTIGAGGDSIGQMDALFAMTKALETYGQTFDHPDWKPVQER